MPRPGVEVEVVQDVAYQGPILDTGQGFFAGFTERGPDVGTARSEGEFVDKWGDRSTDANFHDGVKSFFSEGGGTAYISRDVGPGSDVATAALGTGAMVDAISGGEWGNDIDVRAVYADGSDAAGEPIHIEVDYKDEPVERSTKLSSVDDMVAWAEKNSNFVRFTPEATPDLPAGGTSAALGGGVDGTSDAGSFTAALDRFTYEMGPGQVGSPGRDDPETHLSIGAHIDRNHRCAVIDLPLTESPTELIAARGELDGQVGARSTLAMGSWLNYPFVVAPAVVTIPYSGVQMGIIARTDKLGDVSAVAAGSNGISRLATGLANDFTDADRTNLNANGVTLGRQMFGRVRTYGYRTAAGPDIRDNWTFFQESRVIMAIAHQCNATLEEYVFDTIDGKGHLLVHAKNALIGVCSAFYQAGSLFGATAQEAFKVVCDFSNNPIDTIRLGELHASVYLRTSKIAEWVKVDIVKVPTEREVV